MTGLPTIFRQFANLTTFLIDPPTISNFFDDIFDWFSDWIFRQFPTGFADFPEHLRTDIMRILKTLTRVSCGFWTLLDGYHADCEYSFAHIMRILNTLLRILCGFWILFCAYYGDFEYSFAHIMRILNSIWIFFCGCYADFEDCWLTRRGTWGTRKSVSATSWAPRGDAAPPPNSASHPREAPNRAPAPFDSRGWCSGLASCGFSREWIN